MLVGEGRRRKPARFVSTTETFIRMHHQGTQICLPPTSELQTQLALNSVLDLEVDTSGTQGLISLLTEKIMTASSGVGGHHGISVALVQLHVLA